MSTLRKNIWHFLNDPDKKSYATIFKEVISLWIAKKEVPKYYFGRFLYRKDMNATKFMCMREYYEIIESPNLRSPITDTILHNKLSFSTFCEKHNLPTAKVISYNTGTQFYYDNKKVTITTPTELETFFLSIFEEQQKERLFLKLTEGQQGNGAIMLHKKTLSKNSSYIWKILKDNSYIHQEVINQHNDINAFFDKAANTIRLETYVDKAKNIHFLGCFIRFGAGDAIVDNASSGGLFIPIHIETGILFDQAITTLKGGAKKFLEHPDSNIIFKNFEIPFFQQVKEEVIKATTLLPSRLIGWDIAITPTGPILIEGNHIPGLLHGEYSYHGFLNKPIFKEIMAEAKGKE
ncbi:hypothetical protein GCM10022393_02520 [Aquimarina addita]|uniref:Alpha-L-glutamate ligase-related protein ATP-grasp domain-containing protein n=1 Tax=Aquimarina addita TaxID=870485 RepID=A0ABP7X952_9FLAO